MASAPNTANSDATPAGNGNRRRVVLPILIVLAVLGLGWAVKEYLYARAHESTDDAQVDGDMTPVLAKVGGYVQKITVDENNHVAIDSLLVQIDPAEYQARLEQAEADLAAARAAVNGPHGEGQAQAAVQVAANQKASLAAQIDAAKANRTKADADLARARELVAKQIVSRQQLDAAQAAADAAAAQLKALQEQQSAAASGITAAEAGVRLAQARLDAAKAAVANAQLQLSYTKVTAPMAGIVSRKQVEIGQLVQPGQPMLTVVSDTGVWVTANYKETQLADIRVGQPVEFEVDAYPGCEARGKVESLAGATGAKFALLPPDNATGNFTKVVQRVPIRIAVTDGCGPQLPLRPGMSVVAHIATQ
ncbi:MAG: HlyD family secretion protein [Gemmatimonadota bacterium]|nr:HlyD family secretion protein [Gemmatimonadota bacterium]MDE3172011.1 HlyD family secretion protein [Gemmatimonadota bacterium]